MSDILGLEAAARLLLDARAEARHKAAAGIAQRATALLREKPMGEACRVLLAEHDRVRHLYLDAISAVQRRAGLIVVRAILSGLPRRAFPEPIVQCYTDAITNAFADADPIARVAAVEAAHELVRCFREQVVKLCFHQLFRALACAISDADGRVAALAGEVSLTVREVISGSPTPCLDTVAFANFARETLEPFTTARGTAALPVVVSWVLAWTRFTLDTPGLLLVRHLPVLVPPLLRVACREASGTEGGGRLGEALETLHACKYELKKALAMQTHGLQVAEVIRSLLEPLTPVPGTEGYARSSSPLSVGRLCLVWLHELLLLAVASSGSAATRELTVAARDLSADVLRCVLPHLSLANSAAVRDAAQRVNDDLLRLVAAPPPPLAAGEDAERCDPTQAPMDAALAARVVCALGASFVPQAHSSAAMGVCYDEPTCVGALRWFALLASADVATVDAHYDTLRDGVVAVLCEATSPAATLAAAELLLTLAAHDHVRYDGAVRSILSAMQARPQALLPRLPAVLDVLQTLTESAAGVDGGQSVRLLAAVAQAVSEMALPPSSQQRMGDVRLACKCLIVAHTVLLTSEAFSGLRAALRGLAVVGGLSAQDSAPFALLFRGWRLHAVALLGLCLLSGQDRLAVEVCHHLGSTEASAATLVQLDRLAQMLEGPVFAHLRLRLLRPAQNALLMESLYAMLMILPQWSPQFSVLQNRLSLVTVLTQLESHRQAADDAAKESETLQPMVDSFAQCQAQVLRAEMEAVSRED